MPLLSPIHMQAAVMMPQMNMLTRQPAPVISGLILYLLRAKLPAL